MIHYLSAADLYSINEDVLGERPHVRDRHLLRSAARRPTLMLFGEETFPSILDKAAAVLHSLAYHHLFGDGNKRTATRAVIRFLHENGLDVTWESTAAESFILEIAQGRHEVPDIARWLSCHTVSHTDD